MRYQIIANTSNSPHCPDKTPIAAVRNKDVAVHNCKRIPWPAYVVDRLTGDVVFLSLGTNVKTKFVPLKTVKYFERGNNVQTS